MAKNRIVSSLEDTTIANVAEFAAAKGLFFDEALELVIARGMAPDPEPVPQEDPEPVPQEDPEPVPQEDPPATPAKSAKRGILHI